MAFKTTKKDTAPQAELPKDSDKIYNIKVNRDTQQFYVDDQDLDFGEFSEFTIRVLDVFDKLKSYKVNDQGKTEVDNETTFFKNLKEAKDAKGGTHCGREVYTNVTSKMSDEEKAANKKKAPWYKYTFGIVTVKGKPPILADFQFTGKTMMDVTKLLEKIREDKKELHRAEIKVKALEDVDYDWPTIEIMADFSRELPVTGLAPFFDTINEYVKTANDNVLKKADNFAKYGGRKFIPKKQFQKRY